MGEFLKTYNYVETTVATADAEANYPLALKMLRATRTTDTKEQS